MPKTSREQNGADEKRIVDELLNDPSLEASQIAERTGLSIRKVWRVLQNLEEDGTILGRSVIMDPSKVDKRSYLVLCQRSPKPSDEHFLDMMLSRPITDAAKREGIKVVIQDGYYMSGPYDWAFLAVADEHKEFMRMFELFKREYEGYFSKFAVMEIVYARSRNGVLNPHAEELRGILGNRGSEEGEPE